MGRFFFRQAIDLISKYDKRLARNDFEKSFDLRYKLAKLADDSKLQAFGWYGTLYALADGCPIQMAALEQVPHKQMMYNLLFRKYSTEFEDRKKKVLRSKKDEFKELWD